MILYYTGPSEYPSFWNDFDQARTVIAGRVGPLPRPYAGGNETSDGCGRELASLESRPQSLCQSASPSRKTGTTSASCTTCSAPFKDSWSHGADTNRCLRTSCGWTSSGGPRSLRTATVAPSTSPIISSTCTSAAPAMGGEVSSTRILRRAASDTMAIAGFPSPIFYQELLGVARYAVLIFLTEMRGRQVLLHEDKMGVVHILSNLAIYSPLPTT